MPDFRERADAIAGDRERGASALAAELLPVLDAALAAGHDATVDVARRVCGGQPAMASLWNLCAAALADFVHPGRYALRRAEVERAPDSLTRAATAALVDALQGSTHARVLTLSHSGSVARVLTALSGALTLEVICGESLPGGEGAALAGQLRRHGVRTELVHDTLLTTYLGSASAPPPRSASASGSVAVVMGADAVTAEHWTNKAGTYGLAAAAWFSGVPVYVLASRDKTAAAALALRLSVARPFERTPAQLGTLFLTDVGAIPPDGLSDFTERFGPDLFHLLQAL